MELLSNCCGASIDGLNADNIGICSECKEGCTVEGMDVAIYENKEVLRKYKDKEASHMFGAIQGAFKPEPEDSLIKGVPRKKNKKECKEGCGVEEVGIEKMEKDIEEGNLVANLKVESILRDFEKKSNSEILRIMNNGENDIVVKIVGHYVMSNR